MAITIRQVILLVTEVALRTIIECAHQGIHSYINAFRSTRHGRKRTKRPPKQDAQAEEAQLLNVRLFHAIEYILLTILVFCVYLFVLICRI